MSNHQRVVLETKELNNRQFEYELAINVGAEGYAHNFEVVITHEEKTRVFFHATMRKALDYMEACMAADSQDYIRKAAAEFADLVENRRITNMQFVLTVNSYQAPKRVVVNKHFATLEDARKEMLVEIINTITSYGDDVRNHSDALKKATTIEVGHTIKCLYWLFTITVEDF